MPFALVGEEVLPAEAEGLLRRASLQARVVDREDLLDERRVTTRKNCLP
jgi:hypothetical protein